MSSEAKVSISMLEGKIEFSGSEGFVKEQLSLFKSIIETTLKSTPRQTVIQPTPATPQQKVASEIQPEDDPNLGPFDARIFSGLASGQACLA